MNFSLGGFSNYIKDATKNLESTLDRAIGIQTTESAQSQSQPQSPARKASVDSADTVDYSKSAPRPQRPVNKPAPVLTKEKLKHEPERELLEEIAAVTDTAISADVGDDVHMPKPKQETACLEPPQEESVTMKPVASTTSETIEPTNSSRLTGTAEVDASGIEMVEESIKPVSKPVADDADTAPAQPVAPSITIPIADDADTTPAQPVAPTTTTPNEIVTLQDMDCSNASQRNGLSRSSSLSSISSSALPEMSPLQSPSPSPPPGGVDKRRPKTLGEYENALTQAAKRIKQAKLTAQQAIQMAKKANEKNVELQRLLQTRELQLEKLHVELASQHEVQDALEKERRIASEQSSGAVEQVQMLQAENDNLLQQIAQLQKFRHSAEEQDEVLKGKDQYIAQILEEGKQLSKRTYDMEQSSRKVRKQLAERSDEVQRLKDEAEAKKSHFEAMKAQLQKHKHEEKQKSAKIVELSDLMEELQATIQTQGRQKSLLEGELGACKNQVKDLQKTIRGLQMQLKQAADREKDLAERGTKAEDEVNKHNEFKSSVEEKHDSLVRHIQELKTMLKTEADNYNAREARLQREITELRSKLKDADHRNEELATAVPEATRPLLRQIDSLQASMKARVKAWEAVEHNLKDSVKQAESEKSLLQAEKEALEDTNSRLEMAIASKDAQITVLKQERTKAYSDLHKAQQKLETVEDEFQALKDRLESEQSSVTSLTAKSKDTEKKLRHEMQQARSRAAELEDRVHELETANAQLKQQMEDIESKVPSRSMSTVSTPRSHRSSKADGVYEDIPRADSIERLQASFLDTPSQDSKFGMASTVETLKSLVRQREGEINSLRKHISSLVASRDSLSDKLVNLTSEKSALEAKVLQSSELEERFNTLRVRHSAACEVIGEKTEELEDLKADFGHIKEMFRQQVNELLTQISEKDAQLAELKNKS